MLVVIRGGGDIASGIALRLWRSGIRLVLCETERPTAIRRTVAFSECIAKGETVVEEPILTRDHTERMLAAMGADIRA